MPQIITWDKIDILEKFDYFALGLTPYNKKNHHPIPCPEYCHSYFLLSKVHPNYHPTMDKTLTEWANTIKTNNFETLTITNLPECYLDLMDNDLYYKCADHKSISLDLEDIEQMQASLAREKAILDERTKKRTEIVNEDPDLNSWRFFQMPESEENLENLNNLLNSTVFNKKEVNRIANGLINSLHNCFTAIEPELELFYNNLKSIMRKHGGMLHTSTNHAKNAFEKSSGKFDLLTLEDINGDFYGTGQYTRDIKGGIIVAILQRQFSEIFLQSKNNQNRQKIYDKYKQMRNASN